MEWETIFSTGFSELSNVHDNQLRDHQRSEVKLHHRYLNVTADRFSGA